MTELADWLKRLEQLHPAQIALGLERVSEVYQRLDLDFHNNTVITVAGTNGKGSVVELLQNLLLSAGRSVGVYTSPHILHYNERVRIDGEMLSDSTIVRGFEAVENCRGDVPLTYFEFATLGALHCFAEARPEFIVLEVGLGGRLDAVNIVEPDLTIVTSIALDHQAWLGDDREAIGAEKAGIFRAGVPAICGDVDPPASVVKAAEALGSPLYLWGRDYSLKADAAGLSWRGRSAADDAVELVYEGKTQLLDANIATAIQAVTLLSGLQITDWSALSSGVPGRQEHQVYEGVELIFDVSHNPAASMALSAHLQSLPRVERTCALFAVMGDKDIGAMVAALAPDIDAWFLADLDDNPRAKPARDLAPLLHAEGISMISVSKNMRQAFARVMSMLEPGHRLVVCGSVYTVAAVKAIVARKLAREETG